MSPTATVLHLLMGMALLLWGIRTVRAGIMDGFGGSLRRILKRRGSHRGNAFLCGIGLTLILQSGTATALLITTFAGRAMINLPQALAALLGADLGSALAIQILARDLGWLSSLPLLLGVPLGMAGKGRIRDLGRAFIGLGLILLALDLILNASAPLRHSTLMQEVLLALDLPLGLLTGTLLGWFLHSSLALVLLIASLSSLLPTDLALAMTIGANLGAAIIPLAASSRENIATRLPLWGNFCFRAAGALVAFLMIRPLQTLFETLKIPQDEQVLSLHLGFNIVLAILCLPLTKSSAQLFEKLFNKKGSVSSDTDLLSDPRSLPISTFDNPTAGLTIVARETLRMADLVEDMLRRSRAAFHHEDANDTQKLHALDDRIDNFHEAIKSCLVRVNRRALTESEGRRCLDILAFSTNLEHVGDIIDKNLVELAEKRLRGGLAFSPEGWNDINELYDHVLETLNLAMSVFMNEDLDQARRLLDRKAIFREHLHQSEQQHLERLHAGKAASLATSSIHLDILRDLKRVNSHFVSVAYPILEEAGELLNTRLRNPTLDLLE